MKRPVASQRTRNLSHVEKQKSHQLIVSASIKRKIYICCFLAEMNSSQFVSTFISAICEIGNLKWKTFTCEFLLLFSTNVVRMKDLSCLAHFAHQFNDGTIKAILKYFSHSFFNSTKHLTNKNVEEIFNRFNIINTL